MTRASYTKGIEWIALNDEPGDMDPGSAGEYISSSLLADLFGVPQEKVGEDVVAYRLRDLGGKEYRLPSRFVFDHHARDLPEAEQAISVFVRQNTRHCVVRLDDAGYDELMSDAKYYRDEMASAGFDGQGLISSARATVAALEKQGRP